MPDVHGKRIYLFGDSLSAGQFSPGKVMADRLASAGATVKVNAKVGRSAHNFFARERAEATFQEATTWEPDLVIIVLGTNDIGLSMKIDAQRMADLRDGFGRAGAEVWAFGPPAFPASGPGAVQHAGAPAVAEMMSSVFRGKLLDLQRLSRDLVTPAGGRAADGVHFTAAGGAKLGQRMADRFQDASSEGSDGWLLMGALVTVAYFLCR